MALERLAHLGERLGLVETDASAHENSGQNSPSDADSQPTPQRTSVADLLLKRRTDGSVGSTPVPSVAVSQATISVAASANINPDLLAHFAQVAESSNLPGYADFHRQMEVLAEFIPDEMMRCKAALKASGGNPRAVIQAIADRMGLVASERDGALAAFQTEKSKVLTDHETKTQGIGSRVEELKREIAEREEQVRTLTTQQQQASTELANIEKHYADGSRDIKTAADAVLGDLRDQQTKLQALAKP